MSRKLRIALVVHGRFHGFDLARELLHLGHDVVLFTNYPAFAARRFGIPSNRVRSFLTHGLASRLAWKVFAGGGLAGTVEKIANSVFSRWAARKVLAEHWDVVIAFSGVAEDTFRGLVGRDTLRVLQRGSAHIATQRRILDEEEVRTGRRIDKPSDWIVAREAREYKLADIIHVLSRFAHQSFVEEGVEASRLFPLPLGVNTRQFRATPEMIDERVQRILSGQPLRVLNVGTFCCRKGAWDIADLVPRLSRDRFRFRFVGPVAADAADLASRLRDQAEFCGKFPQKDLPRQYRWGDVFLLPTLEDGFAVVLTQALAAGLPLITSPNCAGPDLVRAGQTGWIVPIRDVAAMVDCLCWLEAHRSVLAEAVKIAYAENWQFDWSRTGSQAQINIMQMLDTSARTRLAERQENAVVKPAEETPHAG